jgi:hypothetical protein
MSSRSSRFPHNQNWEISYGDFTDCHDRVYLGGLTGSFHHNLISDMQDDAIYICPMYATPKQPTDFRIFDNQIERLLTVFAEDPANTRLPDASEVGRAGK